jgi:Ca2+-binding EF-hand superfamily protein
MRVRTVLVTLIAASLVAVSALAQQTTKEPTPKKLPTLSERFAKMDLNHDGIVSEKEYVNAHRDWAADWSKAVFKKTGVTDLSLDRFVKVRQQWEKEFAEHHPGWKSTTTPQEIFGKMDIHHRGKVSESEFVSYWINRAEDHARTMFAKIGGNKDKGLTFAQYATGVKDLERTSQHQLTGMEKEKNVEATSTSR